MAKEKVVIEEAEVVMEEEKVVEAKEGNIFLQSDSLQNCVAPNCIPLYTNHTICSVLYH